MQRALLLEKTMPRYRRYGYVTTVRVEKKGELVEDANIAFDLNPGLANQNLDAIIKNKLREDTRNKVLENNILKPNGDLQGSEIRAVLIRCADGVTLRFSIQRWFGVVGRE